ncbi:ABC transporter permease [Rufibacter tibetensis]|uniref:Transport permease protein n=1 Tax=Rufibacter tibetensis TaxID=512763 RepID=A0A0P0CZF1_9BACT|nr:ABC transporter permease [Rufibacter tibetensis]ALI99908.1 ABC transporter [Rufibacter tibetensis]
MPNNTVNKGNWDWEINSKTHYWGLNVKELWHYRHLSSSLVRKDFLLNYQQTVLGPLWLLLQPLLTLATYILVFNKLIGVSTGKLPPVLFYLSGIVIWNFFHDTLIGTSFIFRENAQIFNKVYFPRLVIPFSQLGTQIFRFGIQFAMLLAMLGFYVVFMGYELPTTYLTISLPFIIILVGLTGLALGLIFSVITAKYRDIVNLVSFGVRLLMFLTPVLYPVNFVPEKVRWIVQFNPLTSYFELFRLALLGEGLTSSWSIGYSIAVTLLLLIISISVFNKQGDKLIDVV